MQWILQKFEDTKKLGSALAAEGIPFTWHQVVPFEGTLLPPPDIQDPNAVMMFGSYGLWKTATENGYWPGVFKIRPFAHEAPWQPHLLNGPAATILPLGDIPSTLPDDDTNWFIRPVDDAKGIPGQVKSATEIRTLATQVLTVPAEDLAIGGLQHNTAMLLSAPVTIAQEWRLWVVDDQIITHSLYKSGARVIYRPEIDADALAFAAKMVALNPRYARAYVLDICRTDAGLHLLETNCLNAAGFNAADLTKLIRALHTLPPDT